MDYPARRATAATGAVVSSGTRGARQGLTMLYYAGKVIAAPEMENPTLVLLTDCNDLDNEFLGTFAKCKSLLRQEPVQAESREHLRDLFNRA